VSVTPESWERIKTLSEGALELEPSERSPYWLKNECEPNPGAGGGVLSGGFRHPDYLAAVVDAKGPVVIAAKRGQGGHRTVLP